MTSANESFRQAANSPASRQAAERAKSIGEEVSDFAGDVGRMASRQYGRAQDMAVDAFDDTYAAMKRNPLLTLGIALGIACRTGALNRNAHKAGPEVTPLGSLLVDRYSN